MAEDEPDQSDPGADGDAVGDVLTETETYERRGCQEDRTVRKDALAIEIKAKRTVPSAPFLHLPYSFPSLPGVAITWLNTSHISSKPGGGRPGSFDRRSAKTLAIHWVAPVSEKTLR